MNYLDYRKVDTKKSVCHTLLIYFHSSISENNNSNIVLMRFVVASELESE